MVVCHDVAVCRHDHTASGTFCNVLLHPGIGGNALGLDFHHAVLGFVGDFLHRHFAAGSIFQFIAVLGYAGGLAGTAVVSVKSIGEIRSAKSKQCRYHYA